MEPQNNQSKFSIPVAIVIAGAVIAGAIFLTKGMPENTPANTGGEEVSLERDLNIPALSTTDHVLGNPNASVSIIEYSDLECPFCKTFHISMQRVMSAYGKDGKVSWAYRHFPLKNIHPKAVDEAVASECVAELGGNDAFWKFIDNIFAVTPSNNQLDLSTLPSIAEKSGVSKSAFNVCFSSQKYLDKVNKEYDEAVAGGGRGTPFTIFFVKKVLTDNDKMAVIRAISPYPPDLLSFSPNGRILALEGALPYENISAVLEVLK